MPKQPLGRDALAQLVERPRLTLTEIARAVGVSRQAVDGWVRGVSTPLKEHRDALHRHYGIAPESWEEQRS